MFNSYFDSNEIHSKGALTNFVLSDKSDGKTFDIKVKGFIRYFKNKSQFIYMRRWKSEISKEMYETFFNELITRVQNNTYVPNNKEEYEIVKNIVNFDFLGTKHGVYIKDKESGKWDIICYFTPLTMCGKRKSTYDVARITHIEYDEFVPMDKRYCPDEMKLIYEFWKTIDRERDETVLTFYGNRIDQFNPFFDFFKITLGIEKEKIKLYKNDTIAIQIYVNKEHREERKKSRFSDMVKGTSFENFDNGGTLFKDTIKIAQVNNGIYFMSFKTEIGEGSIFRNKSYLVISSRIRKDGDLLVDKIYNTGRDEYVCTYANLPTYFKSMAKRGLIYYDKEQTYHSFEPILNKIGGI